LYLKYSVHTVGMLTMHIPTSVPNKPGFTIVYVSKLNEYFYPLDKMNS